MTARYGSFVLVRAVSRAAAVAVLLLFLTFAMLAHAGWLDWLVMTWLAVWLAVRLARRKKRARPSPVADARAERDALQLKLMRTRLATAEANLTLRAPDIAQAARDYAAGRITQEDYVTALNVAGDAARERQERGPRTRFRFR